MTFLAEQLPLHLSPPEQYSIDSFYFSQIELKQAIEHFCDMSDINFLYLWGKEATGKSHLLLAIAEQMQYRGLQVSYLPLAELTQSTSPELLQSLEQLSLLCIDDLQAVAEKPAWQEALFHCFNRLQQTGCKLLVAADHTPSGLQLELADLRSRLGSGLIYHIASLTDEGKRTALIQQALARGLDMPVDVAQYILRHHSRDLKKLMIDLQQLDQASMAAKRRLTIPFVKQILTNGYN